MNKNLSRIAVCALAAAGMAALAAPAHAFRMIQNTGVGRFSAGAAVACNAPGGFTHWNIRNIDWRLNTSGQGAGKDAAKDGTGSSAASDSTAKSDTASGSTEKSTEKKAEPAKSSKKDTAAKAA